MSADGGAHAAARVRIGLRGRFAVWSAAGQDLTPGGAKAQGLLALVATSADFSRSRRWLQDKLWSDRGREQGAGSLRQALTEIRRCLGPDAGVLRTDHHTIGLDRTQVAVIADGAGRDDFLEGIDVRDPEFEAWLRDERLRREPPLLVVAADRGGPVALADPRLVRPAQLRHIVVMTAATEGTDALALFETLFIDCVAHSLREALAVAVFTQVPQPLPARAIAVRVQAFDAGGGRRGLRVQAQDSGSGQILWSGMKVAADAGVLPGDDLGIVQLGNLLIEALGDTLTLRPRDGTVLDSLTLQRLALRKMFSMDPVRMAEADALLAMADEMDPRGIVLAWRAQLRAFQLIERNAGLPAGLRDEGQDLCRRALERDPNNSMVLAVVAYARNALDLSRRGGNADPTGNVELAQRSVALNPHNPLAWDSLSIAKLYAGEVAEAHRIAERVQQIGSTSPNKFWWDMGLCVSAALTGQADLALRMAKVSAAQAPTFHAPLRYMTALHAAADEPEAALAAAERLRAIEPDFTFDTMAHDPSYPVGALRRAGLLRSDRIRALGA